MTRDHRPILPAAGAATPDLRELTSLEKLGWQPFFARQIAPETLALTPPVRVIEVHRNGLHVLGDGIDKLVPPGPDATVGDWLLFDRDHPAESTVLERKSLFTRRAPGRERKLQQIAANVDTAFIVTSCNEDFNVARLERYIVLALEAETTPVIVLTKPDLCDDPEAYLAEASAISNRVPAVMLNALSSSAAMERLAPWCRPGQTVAFLGSSGVGKSTLVNTLFSADIAATADIRDDDSKGRHTTTRRQLHFTPAGCAVLDTPGMRELQLSDVEAGIAGMFDELTALASQCRFRDCRHETEPGCAVRAALEAGEIDRAKLKRWKKLSAEDRFNAATLTERKSEGKALRKQIRLAQKKGKR